MYEIIRSEYHNGVTLLETKHRNLTSFVAFEGKNILMLFS